MNNFWQRAITGLFFVTAIVGLTLYSHYTFLGLLVFISVVGVWEYFRIISGKQLNKFHWLYIVLSGLIVVLPLLGLGWLLLLPAIFGITAIGILLSSDRQWHNIGQLFISLFYIPFPLMMFYHSLYGTDEFFVYMSDESERLANAPFYALNLFILIWSSDTFAYLAGRAFGKHKLFESVSPKKTWEGLIGGTILTMVFSMVLSYYFKIPFAMNALIAALTVVFGTLGDLVESMLKRQYNVKDSGNILPGHGGILDRFDALLISLPFTTLVYYLTFRL
jgi:phosphatidate cytidylyltransferase